MTRWVRYIIIAGLGAMAIVGTFCSDWIDRQLECPTSWSACERSFAYVTRVDADYATAADEGVKIDRCNVVARLPLQKLDKKPTSDAKHLLEGAIRIDTREEDHDRVCESWLHTWQAVAYDPKDRSHSRFASPPKSSGLDLRKLLIVLAIAVCVGYPFWAKYGGRISASWKGGGEARKQCRQARAKRKREAFYAEIRAESEKIDGSVAADDEARRTPPR